MILILVLFGLTLLTGILIMLILVYFELLELMGQNKVVVPSLTVVVDLATYLHGDTVQISGALVENDVGVAGATVLLSLPDGTSPNVTTDKDGKYSASWVVPDSVSGVLTVTATAMGITATTTFTCSKWKRIVYPRREWVLDQERDKKAKQ